MHNDTECLAAVTEVIRETSGVRDVHPDQDFYEAGVTSIQALPLLMELEARFEVSIPDDRFMGARSARSLSELIDEIRKS